MSAWSPWTDKQDDMLLAMWTWTRCVDLTDKLNETFGTSYMPDQVRSRHTYLRYRCGRSDGGKPADAVPSKFAPGPKWTDAEMDALYREWPKGTKIKTIAALVGKTPQQVLSKVYYQRLAPRKNSASSRKRVQFKVWLYVDLEAKVKVVAAELGVSASHYVCSVLARELDRRPSGQRQLAVSSVPASNGGYADGGIQGRGTAMQTKR